MVQSFDRVDYGRSEPPGPLGLPVPVFVVWHRKKLVAIGSKLMQAGELFLKSLNFVFVSANFLKVFRLQSFELVSRFGVHNDKSIAFC
jgi:hypothetical protein